MSANSTNQGNNAQLGIALMVLTTAIFAIMDGISTYLSHIYNVPMIIMIRFWVMAVIVVALAARRRGGLQKALRPKNFSLQLLRGLLLAFEICVMVWGFTLLGLAEAHAIFGSYPLLVVALAGPILGEYAGWRRWLAIAVGLCGILIILRPGADMADPAAFVPFLAAILFALYSLCTRLAARYDDSSVSFFWTGIVGAVAVSFVGLPNWQPMAPEHWAWMAALCLSAVLGHYTLIRCYELSEASAVQPFAYFQLVFATGIGVWIFGESLEWQVVVGASLVVGAGLFSWWRERRRQDQ
ncbi:MAG: DMT family transporter [Mangrovicoccus sp.]